VLHQLEFPLPAIEPHSYYGYNNYKYNNYGAARPAAGGEVLFGSGIFPSPIERLLQPLFGRTGSPCRDKPECLPRATPTALALPGSSGYGGRLRTSRIPPDPGRAEPISRRSGASRRPGHPGVTRPIDHYI
jgi:hypothetical protein